MPPTPSTVRYSAAAPSIVTQSDTRSHQPPQPPLPHSPPQISSATALLNSYTARHPIPSANAPSIATQSATRSHQPPAMEGALAEGIGDRKSTRLNSSHVAISYDVL